MIIKRPPKVMIVKRVSVDITPKLVEDFWRYFQNIYSTRVVQKATAKEMRAAGWFLDRLGTMDRKTFLANYTTTIGKKIYTPFIIGEPNDKWSLLAQLITCVHEHVHVDQSKRHGFARYAYRYLFSTAKRSMYEAEAYRSNMEM
ncbi:MAG: hypothetical protein GY854_17755, partial [Deltaproteobacteria bacterium]|nr:hypothetical protein [Deltaproteobacteria bacterium]